MPDPDLVVRADFGPPGAPRETRGATNWAKGAVPYGHLAKVSATYPAPRERQCQCAGRAHRAQWSRDAAHRASAQARVADEPGQRGVAAHRRLAHGTVRRCAAGQA